MKKLLAMLVVVLGVSTLFAEECKVFDHGRWWTLSSTSAKASGESIERWSITGCDPLPEGEFTVPAKIGNISVWGVGNRAFNGATNITSVTVEKGIKKLGYAFNTTGDGENVLPSNIEKVTLPEGLEYIDCNVFQNSKIENEQASNGFVVNGYLIKYTGTNETYTIPAGVKHICVTAFYWATTNGTSCVLKNIVIPEGVETIQEGAFDLLRDGTIHFEFGDVVLPDSLKSIGKNAFKNVSFKSLKLGKGITDLKKVGVDINGKDVAFKGAFNNVTIESLDFGDGVEAIPNNLFMMDSALKSVKFGSSLRAIGSAAFNRSSVTNFDFSAAAKLEVIGEDAFSDNISTLETVDLSACKKLSSARNAFLDCRIMKSVKLPADGCLREISAAMFEGCSALGSVTIPASVELIDDNAFHNCTALTNVVFNEGLEVIDSYAFDGCTALASIKLPSTVKRIDGYAFNGCSQLATVKLNEGLEGIRSYAFKGCSELTEIDIPGTVTSVGQDLFENCTTLTNVTGGAGIESYLIGTRILGNCPFVTFGEFDSEGNPYPEFAVVSFGKFILGCRGTCPTNYVLDASQIGDAEFIGCQAFDRDVNESLTNIVKVVIPETVLVIDQWAFNNDAGLKTLDLSAASPELPELEIGYEAFRGAGIEELKGDVSMLGENSFRDCAGLKKIDISVEGWIEDEAFEGCTSLTNASVVVAASIGEKAFKDCANLKEVNIAARHLGDNMFSGCPAIEKATVNAKKLPSKFMGNNTNLTELALGILVEEIGNMAFMNCWSLKEIELPETVAYLGQEAFHNCTNLEEVTGGEGLVRVDKQAFYNTKFWDNAAPGATMLGTLLLKWTDDKDGATVEIPAEVENIASHAFLGSTAKKVIIPATVEIVRSYVFEKCPNLETIVLKNKEVRFAVYGVYDGCPLFEVPSSLVIDTAPAGHIFKGWNQEQVREVDGDFDGFWCYYASFEKLRFHNDEAEDGDFDATVANNYTGWIMDGSTIYGSIDVKTAKADRNGKVKVTASVQLSGLKKKYTATFAVDENGKAVIDGKDSNWYNELCNMILGGNWLSGKVTLGGYDYTVRGGNAANAVETFDAYADHVWAIAFSSSLSKQWANCTGYSTLTVTPGKKGKVKVTGMLSDGTKVSSTAQMVAGDNGVIAVPVTVGLYTGKRGGFSFLLNFYMDGDQPRMFFDNADADGAMGTWSLPNVHENYRVWTTVNLYLVNYGEVDPKGTGVKDEYTYVDILRNTDASNLNMLARACKGFYPWFEGGDLYLDKKGKWTFAKATKLSLAKPKDVTTTYAEEIDAAVVNQLPTIDTHDGKELDAYEGVTDKQTGRYTPLSWWIWDFGSKVDKKSGDILWGPNQNKYALNLKYTQKTGAFTGSSLYYWVDETNPEKHALKKGKFTISGVAIDGKLYGSAVVKNVASFFVGEDYD